MTSFVRSYGTRGTSWGVTGGMWERPWGYVWELLGAEGQESNSTQKAGRQ